MLHEYLVLIPIAFVSGMINAAVGGGGLVQIPGLYATLPQALPAQLTGTDKFGAILGHAMSIRQYAVKISLPWRLILPTALAAFVGSFIGTSLLTLVPRHWMSPIVIVVMACMLVYTWLRPEFGQQDNSSPPTRSELIKGAALGAAIGFYDGFIGPGTGSFLLFLFVKVFRFDFLRATACAKVVNFGTNLAALSFLLPAGMVFYHFAIPMGVAAVLGAIVGSQLALRGGNHWIRRLFLTLAITLLCKLSWETVHAWLA